MLANKIRLYGTKLGLYYFFWKLNGYKSNWKVKRQYSRMKNNGYCLPPPEKIIFEPTLRCNLNCKMCYLNKRKLVKPNELNFEQIKKIISAMPFVKTINLIGGEIFLRRDLFEILEFLKNKNIKVILSTNGVLITKEIAARLKNFDNIISVTFSLDGDSKSHNAIRCVPFAFEKTLDAIKEIKKIHPVSIVCVLQKGNFKHLPGFIKILHSIGIKEVALEYERLYSREEIAISSKLLGVAQEDFSLTFSDSTARDYSLKELANTLSLAEKESKKYNVRLYFLPPFFKKKISECYSRSLRASSAYTCKCLFEARIDPYGNVFHCYACRTSRGNVLKTPFMEIWNSEEYKRFRHRISEAGLLPICETCLHMRELPGKTTKFNKQ